MKLTLRTKILLAGMGFVFCTLFSLSSHCSSLLSEEDEPSQDVSQHSSSRKRTFTQEDDGNGESRKQKKRKKKKRKKLRGAQRIAKFFALYREGKIWNRDSCVMYKIPKAALKHTRWKNLGPPDHVFSLSRLRLGIELSRLEDLLAHHCNCAYSSFRIYCLEQNPDDDEEEEESFEKYLGLYKFREEMDGLKITIEYIGDIIDGKPVPVTTSLKEFEAFLREIGYRFAKKEKEKYRTYIREYLSMEATEGES